MDNHLINFRNEHLNTISPSFCAAKWYNASIQLGAGYTGSCHLPLPHLIDPKQIETNPSALHNTDHKKQMRKMMLKGERPAECGYCWKVEDIERNNVSDRVYKSQQYSVKDIKLIKKMPWNEDSPLKTLEISFDRQCNFACSYCSAGYSSTWAQDITKNGPYQNFISNGGGGGAYQTDGAWAENFGRHLDTNPYVEAFFKWWPELSQTLYELRITGGEATVSQNFWRFVDIMHTVDAKDMRFAVNTNLGMSKKALDKLIKITHTLPIKEFDLYTSNESYGAHAEYIRDGLNYKNWRKNMTTFMDQANFRSLTIMMTINNLCLFSLTKFFDDMLELKLKYGQYRPHLSLNILRWPGMMSPLTLPDDVKRQLHGEIKSWLNTTGNDPLFPDTERAQIQRLLDYIDVVEKGHIIVNDDNHLLFHDFKSFFAQYDKRRNKDFCSTFPDLAKWWHSIELNKHFEIKPLHSLGISPPETGVYKP